MIVKITLLFRIDRIEFLAWIIGLGEGTKVLSPEYVVVMMRSEARRLMEMNSISDFGKAKNYYIGDAVRELM